MFENYKAAKEDFEAIEEGIKTVWHPKLNFVFKNKELIKKVIVVSYDCENIYLWTKLKVSELENISCSLEGYHAYKIPHKLELQDEWQLGWRASFLIQELEGLLPKRLQNSNFEIPKINGGLLTPFLKLQKKKKGIRFNPYVAYDSYPATIIHEFGHVIWNHHKLWWYSNKKENLRYLREAKQLYENQKKNSKVSLTFPMTGGIGEIFAFCTEYEAASLFWSTHRQNLDIFINHRLEKLISEEKKKNLEQEDSVLEPSRTPHDFSFVFGKIILSRYPKTWPQVLCPPKLLKLSL